MANQPNYSQEANQRKRTNLLKNFEAKTIQFLCKHMPLWITSNMLTAIGFIGSIIIGIGLYMAKENKYWLLLSILGFAIQWFGDSLDGRLAYYRNIPRKWYGWSLDITIDWISVGIIGFGFYYYLELFPAAAFVFIFAYGWSMINALLKYKITDIYSIDASLVGPTELRFIICFFLILEIYIPHALTYFAIAGSAILIIINFVETNKIITYGDQRDIEEKKKAN